jgi:hypothetical protein
VVALVLLHESVTPQLVIAGLLMGLCLWLHLIAKLVLAEEALADRGAALRSGNVRNATDLPTGLDVLGLEVAAVGDDVDPLDVQNLAGRFCGLRQQPISTTWLVTACSTISLFFVSTATWML